MASWRMRVRVCCAIALLAACGGRDTRRPEAAQAFAAVQEGDTTPVREWRLPADLYPFQVAASAGKVFFLAQHAGYPSNTFAAGQLDVPTGTLTDWPVPSWMTSPADVLVRASGSEVRVWITDVLEDKLGVLDPRAATYTEWPVGEARDLAVDPERRVFFSTMNGIGRLDPGTDTVTYWHIPARRIEDVATDSTGRVLFTMMRWVDAPFDGIGMLDPATGTVTEWSTPMPLFGVEVDASGDAFFCTESRTFARLSPATGCLTSWPLGESGSCGEFVGVGPAAAFASGTDGRGVYQLDPAMPGTDTALLPATYVVSPTSAAVTPTSVAVSPTTTTIAPAMATATGVATGAVTRWRVDLPASYPRGIAVDERGTLFYTDQGRMAIGAMFEGPAELEVAIDIHPGSADNCVNVNGAGVIPVAVLTDGTFDASIVDPSTVALEGMPVKTVGKANRPLAHLEDVDGDGDLDLVVQVEDTGTAALSGPTATLTGALRDGTAFHGSDAVCVVP